MKRPSFQFYPADWRGNSNLRRCSMAARGAWIEVMCVLHDSDEYGVVRWPLEDLSQASGVEIGLLNELISKGVLKGDDTFTKPFTYAFTHARTKAAPVTIVEATGGPCWFSSRMTVDERKRLTRGFNTRFSEENQPKNNSPKPSPTRRNGERHGDGSASTSTSTNPIVPKGTAKGVLQLRAERIMGRRPETPLTQNEKRAFAKNADAIKSTSEEDWKLLELFYSAPQSETYARKDLVTLVNNWNGEIDRARIWASSGKKSGEQKVFPMMTDEQILREAL